MSARRLALRPPAAALLFAAACASPRPGEDFELSIGPSLLPNIGVAASAGQAFHRSRASSWIFETNGVFQFLDDSDVADAGNSGAEDWYQLGGGVKVLFTPDERRHASLRAGVVWLRALGDVNLIDDPGDYFGFYVGGGFETELGRHLSTGPDLILMTVFPEGGGNPELVPQLAWRLIWRF
jgi:hypothetical protein